LGLHVLLSPKNERTRSEQCSQEPAALTLPISPRNVKKAPLEKKAKATKAAFLDKDLCALHPDSESPIGLQVKPVAIQDELLEADSRTRNGNVDATIIRLDCAIQESGSQIAPGDAQLEADTQHSFDYSDHLRESIYVKAFNTAVDTVLEREGHLFCRDEMNTINLYRTLPCSSPIRP
jgi:hypothetical protein